MRSLLLWLNPPSHSWQSCHGQSHLRKTASFDLTLHLWTCLPTQAVVFPLESIYLTVSSDHTHMCPHPPPLPSPPPPPLMLALWPIDDDIRQNEGFKNVSLGNVISSAGQDKRVTFLRPEDRVCMCKFFPSPSPPPIPSLPSHSSHSPPPPLSPLYVCVYDVRETQMSLTGLIYLYVIIPFMGTEVEGFKSVYCPRVQRNN